MAKAESDNGSGTIKVRVLHSTTIGGKLGKLYYPGSVVKVTAKDAHGPVSMGYAKRVDDSTPECEAPVPKEK
jgi:hypothetical protein